MNTNDKIFSIQLCLNSALKYSEIFDVFMLKDSIYFILFQLDTTLHMS